MMTAVAPLARVLSSSASFRRGRDMRDPIAHWMMYLLIAAGLLLAAVRVSVGQESVTVTQSYAAAPEGATTVEAPAASPAATPLPANAEAMKGKRPPGGGPRPPGKPPTGDGARTSPELFSGRTASKATWS